MKSLILSWIVLILAQSAFADVRVFEFYRQRALSKFIEVAEGGDVPTNAGLQEYSFDQKLDHNNPEDTRTFKQRYFINSSMAGDKETSPVLLYICGESECKPKTSVLTTAGKLKAHVVYVEHRYYGKSLPMKNLTTENLKYLSTPQALEDLKVIESYLQDQGYKGKWIVMGGSYAGSLSAYYRLKYPEMVVGALASSGPVQARENFEVYDLHVSKVVGEGCGARMKFVVAQVESLLDKPEEILKVKKQFKAEALNDNVDFLYLIADMGAFAVQYGAKDDFCQQLLSDDPLSGYANFTKNVFALYGMDALSMSAAGAVDPVVTEDSSGMRQWFYQSCTEYGYWQNAYHDPAISVRSSLINLEYHKNICKRLFGLDMSGNEIGMNEIYYTPLLNPDLASNILFTNGSTDPWLNLSIASENKNDINTNTQSFTMSGASHCSDLGHSGLPDVALGQELFVKLSKKWLGLPEN